MAPPRRIEIHPTCRIESLSHDNKFAIMMAGRTGQTATLPRRLASEGHEGCCMLVGQEASQGMKRGCPVEGK